MGQQEVIKLLEKNNDWIDSYEISEKLKHDPRNVRRALKVLSKYGEVLRKVCKESKHFKYVYKSK